MSEIPRGERLVDTQLGNSSRFPAPDVVVRFADDKPGPPGPRSILVWEEERYSFRNAEAQFWSSTIDANLWWHRMEQGDLFARALSARKGEPVAADPQPIGAWLTQGLRDDRWRDPAHRPPIVVEAHGWYAFTRLVRGLAPPESLPRDQVEEAIAALVAMGARLDATFEVPPFGDRGPLPTPQAQAREVDAALEEFVSGLID